MSLNFDCASSDCLDWILINCLLGFQQRTLCHIPRRTQVSSNFTDGFCTYSWDANEVWCACHWLPNTVKLHSWAVSWIVLGLSLLGFTLSVWLNTLLLLLACFPSCLLVYHVVTSSFFCSSDGCGLAIYASVEDSGGLYFISVRLSSLVIEEGQWQRFHREESQVSLNPVPVLSGHRLPWNAWVNTTCVMVVGRMFYCLLRLDGGGSRSRRGASAEEQSGLCHAHRFSRATTSAQLISFWNEELGEGQRIFFSF